jgi:arabinofuranan 3-O-arabinosyltransferase
VADGRHSVPTSVRLTACDQLAANRLCPTSGSQSRTVSLPTIADGRRQNATVAVPVRFPALTGRYLTVTFTRVRLETTKDYSSRTPIALPMAIAELGIPGVRASAPPPSVPSACRSDLATIDGHPISMQLSGSTTAALDGQGLAVHLCGADAAGITLSAGRHVLQSADGFSTGFNVDQVVLDSAPGGGAAPAPGAALVSAAPAPVSAAPAPVSAAPVVHVTSATATELHLQVTGATKPFWLVLGESLDAGWQATVAGRATSLGPPTLIDGFANGWLVDPAGATGGTGSGAATGARTLSVTLRWTPQRTIDAALLSTAAFAALCLVLVLWPRSRRRARHRRVSPSALAAAGSATEAGAPGGAPVLASPFAVERTLELGSALLVALACGVGSALIVPKPEIGILVALAVLVALIAPRGRGLSAGLVPVLVAGAVLYTVVAQVTRHFITAGWTNHFETANLIVWAAVVLLGADVVVELVRRRR